MDRRKERREAVKEGVIRDGIGGGGVIVKGVDRCHTLIFAANNLEFVEKDLPELRDVWSWGEEGPTSLQHSGVHPHHQRLTSRSCQHSSLHPQCTLLLHEHRHNGAGTQNSAHSAAQRRVSGGNA